MTLRAESGTSSQKIKLMGENAHDAVSFTHRIRRKRQKTVTANYI